METKLLRFNDNCYPDELIIKRQGMGKWLPFKGRTTIPISHIDSVRIIDSKNNHDAQILKVKRARSLRRASSLAHDKKNQDGKVLTIAMKDEKCKELHIQVDDDESENVVKVLHEMCNED